MQYNFFKRLLDFFGAIVGILIFSPFIIILYILSKIFLKGSFIFWSQRVGKNGKIFLMPKIRTMHPDTPQVATHLLINPRIYINSFGSFLRKSSLDELPQLWSILIGRMSFVGPRPALFNEDYLIKLRKIKSIDKLVPGLTGWAQINGRDDLDVKEKVSLDLVYLKNCSLFFDLKILFLTFILIFRKKNILH